MNRLILILIIVIELTGLYQNTPKRLWHSMMFYTQLSNAAALLSALLLLLFGPLTWIVSFRYLAVCMLVMTCLVTVFVLVPTIRKPRALLWGRVGFLLHVLGPLINLVSYAFFETHVTSVSLFIPPVLTLIYGIIMITLNYQKKVDGPYPFFRVYKQSTAATVMWILILLCVISLISYSVFAFC